MSKISYYWFYDDNKVCLRLRFGNREIRILLNHWWIAVWSFFISWLVIVPLFGGWAGLIIMLSLLAHELGHMVVARQAGIKRTRLLFIPLVAGVLLIGQERKKDIEKILYSLGGPVVNYVIAIVCLFAYKFTGVSILNNVAIVNLLLCILNIIPIGILDGGSVVATVIGRTKLKMIVGVWLLSLIVFIAGCVWYAVPWFILLVIICFFLYSINQAMVRLSDQNSIIEAVASYLKIVDFDRSAWLNKLNSINNVDALIQVVQSSKKSHRSWLTGRKICGVKNIYLQNIEQIISIVKENLATPLSITQKIFTITFLLVVLISSILILSLWVDMNIFFQTIQSILKN